MQNLTRTLLSAPSSTSVTLLLPRTALVDPVLAARSFTQVNDCLVMAARGGRRPDLWQGQAEVHATNAAYYEVVGEDPAGPSGGLPPLV